MRLMYDLLCDQQMVMLHLLKAEERSLYHFLFLVVVTILRVVHHRVNKRQPRLDVHYRAGFVLVIVGWLHRGRAVDHHWTVQREPLRRKARSRINHTEGKEKMYICFDDLTSLMTFS